MALDQPCPLAAMPDDKGPAYEDEHVHQVYEQIASHFSETRYKVSQFHRVCALSSSRL